MFSTLDATSFKQLNSQASANDSHSLPMSVRDFVLDEPRPYRRKRSKTGCHYCRYKRKKKCDEVHPICGTCKERGLECIWSVQEFNPAQSKFKSTFLPMTIGSKSSSLNTVNDSDSKSNSPNSPTHEPDTRQNTPQPIASDETVMSNSKNDHSHEFGFLQASEVVGTPAKLWTPSSFNQPFFSPASSKSPNNHKRCSIMELVDDEDTSNNDKHETEVHTESLDPEVDYTTLLRSYSSCVEPTEVSLYSQPSNNFSLYLDSTGLELLDIYQNQVIRMICISPESSNYFLKTYLPIAASEEAITHALAAWGASQKEGPNSELHQQYRMRARKLMEEKYINNPNLDKQGFFVLLCYYLIDTGSEIFSGDTEKWYTSFKDADKLLSRYGSVEHCLQAFDNSNDIKFLVANFQFHDIMSSVTVRSGTSCKILSYRSVFRDDIDILEYGIDPYQGCIQRLYLLLGEIFNASVEFKAHRESLAQQMDSVNQSLLYDEEEVKALNEKRVKHYVDVDNRYNELLESVNALSPNEGQLFLLSHDSIELEHHLTLFELYRNTCKIYLLLYIKQTQPKSSEVQLLLLDSFKLIDLIIDSKLKSTLVMPLIICGICCVTPLDRFEMRNKFNKMYVGYKAGNVKRASKVVEESWRLNADGSLCIDWVSICEDFGWKLSVG